MSARVVVGISGASGAAIGLRVIGILREMKIRVDVVVSGAAERTLAQEVGPDALATLDSMDILRHSIDNIGAKIASGSSPT